MSFGGDKDWRLHTSVLPAIVSAHLLPLIHSFWIVMCIEGGISSSLWLVDDIAVSVAEDLCMCCNEQYPYRHCNVHRKISMRQELRND